MGEKGPNARFWWRNPRECGRFGFLAVDGREIFKRIWKYQGTKYWINLAKYKNKWLALLTTMISFLFS
jgi:hypothetical protein